jgi:hypothetical protein
MSTEQVGAAVMVWAFEFCRYTVRVLAGFLDFGINYIKHLHVYSNSIGMLHKEDFSCKAFRL